MSAATPTRAPRLSAVMREGERVTPLELFFDLVFVLALTQCTTLMAAMPTWEGIGRGLLVLAVLWWSWTGYAWLTSVLDPEEGAVRLVVFGAMAAMLIAALCAPHAFGSDALLFACAYAVVRGAHIMLFLIASREDAGLRRSVLALAVSTAIAVGLLLVAAFLEGAIRGALWVAAVALDMAGPFLFGAEGWQRAQRDRQGLLLLSAPSDGRRDRAAGVGAQQDARARRGSAQSGACGGAAGRCSDVSAGARGIQAAQHAHAQPRRLVCAAILVAMVPLAIVLRPPSLLTLALLALVLAALIAYEALRFADARDRIRHQL